MKWATASWDALCNIHDGLSGKRTQVFQGHSRPVLSIAFLPDGKQVVSAGIDMTLRLWNTETGELLRSMDNHVAAVNDLAVHPLSATMPNPIVASASSDRTVRLWQPTIGRLVRFARLPVAARTVAWTSDGTHLIAGCDDGVLRIIDAERVERIQDCMLGENVLYSVAYSQRAAWIATGDHRGIIQLTLAPATGNR